MPVSIDGEGLISGLNEASLDLPLAQAQVTDLVTDLAGKSATAYTCFVSVLQPFNAQVGGAQTYQASTVLNSSTGMNNSTLNNYVEWVTPPTAAGTFTLTTYIRKAASHGIASVIIDGATLGTTIDAYNGSTTDNNRIDITGIALAAGRHTIRFQVTSKNASSTGYYLNIEGGVMLTRTGA